MKKLPIVLGFVGIVIALQFFGAILSISYTLLSTFFPESKELAWIVAPFFILLISKFLFVIAKKIIERALWFYEILRQKNDPEFKKFSEKMDLNHFQKDAFFEKIATLEKKILQSILLFSIPYYYFLWFWKPEAFEALQHVLAHAGSGL